MKGENDLDVWIDHAEDDFNAAGKLLRGKKPSIYGACFHAQQCAEKYMKAILVFREQRFPMTHDLVILNTLLQQVGVDMQISEDLLELLSSYAVRARYSGETPEMDDAKEALKIAKQVRAFSRKFLGIG
ncbi:MAG: HEPN domain-containing protein [Anaerolineales bacterium]|jgi:HEPN domain-containing protein|nr:HEPN domain-containing protein [Anaerolineales bacterium]